MSLRAAILARMDPLARLKRAIAFVLVALLLAWLASGGYGEIGDPQADDRATATAPVK